jgi:hypothetical protein
VISHVGPRPAQDLRTLAADQMGISL